MDPLHPEDLVGCRHRGVLRREINLNTPIRMRTAYDLEQTVERLSHRISSRARKQEVLASLPKAPRRGDKLIPTRVDIERGDNAVEDTLEAMAAGTRLIIGATLEHGPMAATVDLLVRRDAGFGADPGLAYAPVLISAHSVARAAKKTQRADCLAVPLGGLSLSQGVSVPYRHRAIAKEGQQLAMAHVILEQWGFAAPEVGLIGHAVNQQEQCYFFPGAPLRTGLLTALSEPIPTTPSRVRECAVCEFHNHCRAQLLESLDVSLMLPGDRSRAVRDRGINTLPELAATEAGEQSALAEAWMNAEVARRRPLKRWITDTELWGGHEFRMPAHGQAPMVEELRDVVDLDVDMEAHPQRGTFLWGTFDGSSYVGFGDFSTHGDEGAHVAEFWAWLQARRASAEAHGQRLRVWVYAAQGENYWLRTYAQRFGGREYTLDDGRVVVMPGKAEVDAFIESDAWCDLFRLVKKALAGTGSLGLKAVAPLAGFTFSQEGVDGKAAVDLFEQAIGLDSRGRLAARRTLERYNADDCVATSHVRAWLRAGAPGIRGL